jgi:hypothetical protein
VTREAKQTPLPDELGQRTLTLLTRGAPMALGSLVLLVIGPVAIALASEWFAKDVPLVQGSARCVGIACSLVVPLMVHAGPMSAFVIAVSRRPRLGETVRLAFASATSVIGATLYCLLSGIAAAAAVNMVSSFATWDGPPSAGFWCVVTASAIAIWAAWVHGEHVLLASAVAVLGLGGRSRSGTPEIANMALGAIPIGTVLVIAVPTISSLPTPSVPGLQRALVIVGSAVVLLAAHVISCALAVAIATRPAAASGQGSGTGSSLS